MGGGGGTTDEPLMLATGVAGDPTADGNESADCSGDGDDMAAAAIAKAAIVAAPCLPINGS
jgi:hypothetical protein